MLKHGCVHIWPLKPASCYTRCMAVSNRSNTRPQWGRLRCPPVVAAALSDLTGPAGGVIELPQHLFWSAADRRFDLDARHDALAAYQSVLHNARNAGDLTAFLNAALLCHLWGDLILSARVRRAWETAHPELAAAAPVSAA